MKNFALLCLSTIGLVRHTDGSRMTPAEVRALSQTRLALPPPDPQPGRRVPEPYERKGKMYTPWTPAEDILLCTHVAAGGDTPSFAKAQDRSAKSVAQRHFRLTGLYLSTVHPPTERHRAAAQHFLNKKAGPLLGTIAAQPPAQDEAPAESIEEPAKPPATPEPGPRPVVDEWNPDKVEVAKPVTDRSDRFLRRWTAAEDAKLTRMVDDDKGGVTIGLALDRTPSAVIQRADKLLGVRIGKYDNENPAPPPGSSRGGKPGERRKRWTEEEDAILKMAVIEKVDIEVVAAELGRTRRAVEQRTYKLYKDPAVRTMPARQGQDWSDLEVETIRKAGDDVSDLRLAARLYRSPKEITSKRKELRGGVEWHRVAQAAIGKTAQTA